MECEKAFQTQSNTPIIEIEHVDDNKASSDEEDTSESVMQEPFDPSHINIMPKQDTLRNLIDRIKDEAIDMNTDFQRHADLWDNQKMSRLVESILIRFPLPAFYFDASSEDKWLIVDGLQRLSSIKKFVVDKKLKLSNLEYLKDLKGKTYDNLTKTYQRRINECPVTLFLIQPGTPEAVKYSVFRRINTGGIVLNNQEIRNAMAKPEVRKFLEKLVQNEYLKQTIGDQSRRMMDQELVLRFLAFHFMDYIDSKKNIATFLDEMMNLMNKASSENFEQYEKSFETAIQRCWNLFGDRAFEKKLNEDNSKTRKKNSTLFEVWMNKIATITEENMNNLLTKKDELVKKHSELLEENGDYFKAVTYSTQKKEHYIVRCQKIDNLIKEVLNA